MKAPRWAVVGRVYTCPGCKWGYLYAGPDRWEGPHRSPEEPNPHPAAMTTEDFRDQYADCAASIFNAEKDSPKASCTAPVEVRRSGIAATVGESAAAGVVLLCSRRPGHKKRHRARGRFAGPTDLTVEWPQ